MTCPECDRLRDAWYATATPVPIVSVDQATLLMEVVKKDRKRSDYRAALDAYREHLKGRNDGIE